MTPIFRYRIPLLVVLVVIAASLVGTVFVHDRTARAEAAVEASRYRPPPIPTPTVVFIGDSYTAGVGASRAGRGWTSLVSTYEGWTEVNLAIGGTGYAKTLPGCKADQCSTFIDSVQRAEEFRPSIVVVSGGQNDSGVSGVRAREAVREFFPALRAAFPRARLYVTSPVWGATGAPIPSVQALEAPIKSAANAVGATYLPFGQPLQEHPELINPKNGHPSDAGHRVLARVIETQLARVGVGNAP